MKGVGIFALGFIAGIVVTIIAVSNMDYDTNEPSEPSDGLYGLTIFTEKGECIIHKLETIRKTDWYPEA